MRCSKCNKPIKENTEGDNKYCQGHSVLEDVEWRKRAKEMPRNAKQSISNIECDFGL